MEKVLLSVSDFIALTNQVLDGAYPQLAIEGEVASFKVNQGKYVFFDLKDETGSISCFMTVWQLRTPIEDGMTVVVTGVPNLTKWGKFSVTVRAVKPKGEGALKKSFELLKQKLEEEGLFSPERKRPLPAQPRHIGAISSTGAAGYADFIKILNDRWGGVKVDVAHVQVQGEAAPDHMIRALERFNAKDELPEVLVLIRGGGSADDLAAFNDEKLVRAIAASRIPTLVGVGHETDETLADLVADVRAATPSNAAQLLVPDKHDVIRAVQRQVRHLAPRMQGALHERREYIWRQLEQAKQLSLQHILYAYERLQYTQRLLEELNPDVVLRRGYAIIRGARKPGHEIEIELKNAIIKAEVKTYDEKH